MALRLFWSDVAVQNLEEIITYFEKHWTEKEISKFFRLLEARLEHIQEHPSRFKKSERKPGTRECLLSPQTTIFYSYDKASVYIHLVWINRWDPKNL
jgi:plasmid stabilization system protein ParE